MCVFSVCACLSLTWPPCANYCRLVTRLFSFWPFHLKKKNKKILKKKKNKLKEQLGRRISCHYSNKCPGCARDHGLWTMSSLYGLWFTVYDPVAQKKKNEEGEKQKKVETVPQSRSSRRTHPRVLFPMRPVSRFYFIFFFLSFS